MPCRAQYAVARGQWFRPELFHSSRALFGHGCRKLRRIEVRSDIFELPVANADDVHAADREAPALVINQDGFPLEGGLVAGTDLMRDRDFETGKGVSHAVIKRPNLVVSAQRPTNRVEHSVFM